MENAAQVLHFFNFFSCIILQICQDVVSNHLSLIRFQGVRVSFDEMEGVLLGDPVDSILDDADDDEGK